MKIKIAIAFVTLLALILLPLMQVGAQVKQPAEWITAKRLTVATRADIGTTLTAPTVAATALTAGSAAVTGNASVAGNLAVTGQLIGSTDLYLIPATAISVTDGGVITPTGAVQLLTSAGTVTPTLATASAGRVLVLVNTANTSIVLVDAGTTNLASDMTLTQNDTLTLVGNGVSWYEVARSTN